MPVSPLVPSGSAAALPWWRSRDAAAIHRVASFGRLLFAGGIVAFGIQHFFFGDFVPGRAPPWPDGVAGKLMFAWITGLVFVASGIALLTGRFARTAALVAGALIDNEADAARLMAVAKRHEVECQVIDPQLIEVELKEGGPRPTAIREAIRAFGPTVRTDLTEV